MYCSPSYLHSQVRNCEMSFLKKVFNLVVCSILFLFSNGAEIPKGKDFSCPCLKIGLDDKWADSNRVECYLIPVQRDILNPGDSVFRMAVAVVKSDHQPGNIPLLYLHGGPGISTLGNLPKYLNAPAWQHLRQNRNIIFFDYRGTGFSEPALCKNELDTLMQFGRSNPTYEQWIEREVQEYLKCRNALPATGISLGSFTSMQMAADADEIRKALKIDTWNVYGVSYGTFIGLSYVKNFPAAIQSLVLDSPFPPNVPWLDFVRPVDTAFKYLQKKLLENPVTAGQFPSFRKDFAKAIDSLNKQPLKIDGINYYGDQFAWSVYNALVKSKMVRMVPLLVQEVAKGNYAVLPKWKLINSNESFGSFHAAQQWAVLCYENRIKDPKALQDSLAKTYPELKSFNMGFNIALCDAFRPEQPDPAIFEAVKSDIPALILSGGFDPATPPLFGAIAKASLTQSTHLVIPQASHAVMHFNPCVYTMVDDFLSKPQKINPPACIAEIKGEIDFVLKDIEKVIADYK